MRVTLPLLSCNCMDGPWTGCHTCVAKEVWNNNTLARPQSPYPRDWIWKSPLLPTRSQSFRRAWICTPDWASDLDELGFSGYQGHVWDDFDTVRKRVAEEWPALPKAADVISQPVRDLIAQVRVEHFGRDQLVGLDDVWNNKP